MGLIKLSGFVSKISGKLGGNIFGSGLNGTYIKSNSYSQQPNTPLQSIQRNKIVQFTQQWRNATPTQKENWAAETVNYPYINRVGETVYYNAYQLFIKLNSNRLIIGQSILLDPPTFEDVSPVIFGINNLTVASFILFWTGNTSANTVIIQASPQMLNGVKPKASQYLEVARFNITSVNGTQDIRPEYIDVFGPPIASSFIYIRARAVVTDTGYSQEWQENIFDIVS